MAITAAFLDSREPQNMQGLKFGGVPVAITTLECGDAWIATDDGNLLCIERKTPSDLLGSIKDGRLFLQCAAMRAKTPWAYLLLTGALAHTLDGHVITDNRTTGWKYDDVIGALTSVQEMGVVVVSCQSDSHYEAAIIKLSRRDRREVKAVEPRTQARVLTQQEQVLISLPGIGLERAGLLLGEHGSAAYSIAWLSWLDSISEMEGIGNGTKNGVRRALGLAADEWLSVMTTEKSAYAAREIFQEVSTPILGV
jgi:ERCC4-type nuclease